MRNDVTEPRIFNTSFDIGLRALFLITEAKKPIDLQSLVYLDYFLVHSGDIKDGPESLQPSNTFRAGEILIKRNLMKDGLYIMHLKQLLDILPQEKGIYYAKNKLGCTFVKKYFKSAYSDELLLRAKWVNKKFGRFDEDKLKHYVKANITKWGLEFIEKKKTLEYHHE